KNAIIADIQNTKKRKHYLKFTNPYISNPNVIIVGKNLPDNIKLSDLNNKSVAIVKGYATIDVVKNANPQINIIEVKDNIEALQMVAFKQVDAVITDLAVASYYIESLHITNLKIAGNIHYDWHLCFATNKKNDTLHSIIQKGLNSIPQSEKDQIAYKWIELKVKPFYSRVDFWLVTAGILLFFSVIFMTILTWNKTLKKKVKQKTYELEKANKELHASKQKAEESDKLKEEFINNMSHEIRTPMNGILGFCDFLSDPETSDSQRKEYIQIIKNSGTQLMRIIDDIIEISVLGTKQMEAVNKPVCLNQLLNDLFSIFSKPCTDNNTPLRLKKELTDDESYINSDNSKLFKILSNLIENAIKFTTEGYIELGYSINKSSKPHLLELYVQDTGIGIHPDKQASIFERFSQEEKELSRKVGGLGLGLAIAKENTILLGGNIGVQSGKGEGAKFTVSIPYEKISTKSDTSDNQICIPNNIEEKVVLIVEDEELNSLYYETLLKKQKKIKFKILNAKKGAEAIQYCKSLHIDLILLDINLPDINGIEVCKNMQKIRPEIPIIAQTGFVSESEKDQALEAGCSEFITKPVDKKLLLHLIYKHIN
ncbi:MAG: hypothetical protein C0594_05410, partial [Marinilabiliales bacterium]